MTGGGFALGPCAANFTKWSIPPFCGAMPKAFRPQDFARLAPPSWGDKPSVILRPGAGPYTRSPYALEDNPWVSREEWETLLLLRGAIVASFGQIETTLGEIALRLSRDERCAALRSTYPHAIDKRLKFLRKCFNLEPYKRRSGLANQILTRFESSSALRHVMAHGRINGPTHGWLSFRDFKASVAGEVISRDHRFTFDELEKHACSAALLARRVQRLASSAQQTGWLPSE